MATEIIHSIRSSGGDYTSLSAWEAAQQRDLVAVDEVAIAECYDDWVNGLSDQVTISGWTTDTTRNIIIRAATGHRHNGTPQSGFFISKTQGFASLINVLVANVELNGMDVENGSFSGRAISPGNNSNVLVVDCIAKSNETAFTAIGTGVTIRKCLAYDSVTGFDVLNWTAPVLQNCISENITNGVRNGANGAGATLQNFVCFGNANSYVDNGSGYSGSNNAASDAIPNTPPGTSPLLTNIVSGDFVDEPNNNFHLASGSSLDGAGVDLSADFTTDIDGDTIVAPWPIGFDYIASAGGAFSITGDVTKTKTSNAALNFTSNFSLSGAVTKTKVSNATLSFSSGNSIAGLVIKTKTSNAVLEFNSNELIVGDVTKTKVSNALLSFNANESILGSITKTKVSNAVLAFISGNSILGDITKTKTPASSMSFLSPGSFVINGDITKTKVSNALLDFTANYSLSGDVTKTKLPASGMVFFSPGSFVINGDITKTKTSNSTLLFNSNSIIVGDVTKTKTSNATLAFNQNHVLSGDVTKTKTPDSVFEFIKAENAINGSVTKTKTSNALFNFTGTRFITGDITKTKTPLSVLKYSGGTGCFTVEEAINKLLRDVVNEILAQPGFSIRAKQKDSPRPRGAYAIVDFISDTSLGWEQFEYDDRVDNNLDSTVRGMREIMMSVGFYRDSAIDNARKVRTGLVKDSIQSLFSLARVGLIRRSPVTNISNALENGWEDRAQFDVFLSVVGCDEDIINSICSVDIAGEYQERKTKYNFNIGVQI